MNLKMKKKGYFFMLDALLALSVLIMGVTTLLNSFTFAPEKRQTINLAEDAIDFFANTKLEDFNNPLFGPSGTLVKSGVITDTQKTLLQQLGEFYYNGDLGNAGLLAEAVMENLIPYQYSYEILINGTTIYSKGLSSKGDSEILFPARELSFGTIGNTLDLFGPYKLEVLVWK